MVKRTRGLRPSGVLPIGFLIIILMGSLLLMTPAATNGVETLSFSDALFTATSASCVTGLIVRDTGTFFSPFGQVVIIVLIQLGGLGFMTMSTILFSMTRRRVSMFERMSMAEGLGEDRLQGVVKLCRGAVLVTGVCEGAIAQRQLSVLFQRVERLSIATDESPLGVRYRQVHFSHTF